MSGFQVRAIAVVTALGLLLAACSGEPAVLELDPASVTTTSRPSRTSTTVLESVEVDLSDLEAAWVAMWDGAELLTTDAAAAESAIVGVADAAVFETLVVLYDPTIEGAQIETTARVFDNNPVLAEQPDGSVLIDDCLFESPKVGNKTTWYRGTAVSGDAGWRIESVEVVNAIGCVPRGLADAAFAGYDAYWDARLVFWDPPDPDHPLVEATLAEPQLDHIRGLLVDSVANGWVMRGRHTSNYEIIEVRSPTDLAIRDCQDQDPARGLFMAETGERLDDLVGPIVEGQRDFLSAVMLLEGETWKVSDVQAQRHVLCEYPPSPQGLPIVG